MFDLISPWNTYIAKGNFDKNFPAESLTNNILENFDLQNLKTDLDDFNIFDSSNETLNQFRVEFIEPALKDYFLKVWKVSFWEDHKYFLKGWLSHPYSGYKMKVHNHLDSQLGGVFYLDCKQDQSGGEIVFYDPRMNFNRGFGSFNIENDFQPQVFTPNTGDFFIFPSSLYHSVNQFHGDMRMALIVDLFIED